MKRRSQRTLIRFHVTQRVQQYVLENDRHHAREYLPPRWRDPLSSAAPKDDAPVPALRTWLLRVGWKRVPPPRKVVGYEP